MTKEINYFEEFDNAIAGEAEAFEAPTPAAPRSAKKWYKRPAPIAGIAAGLAALGLGAAYYFSPAAREAVNSTAQTAGARGSALASNLVEDFKKEYDPKLTAAAKIAQAQKDILDNQVANNSRNHEQDQKIAAQGKTLTEHGKNITSLQGKLATIEATVSGHTTDIKGLQATLYGSQDPKETDELKRDGLVKYLQDYMAETDTKFEDVFGERDDNGELVLGEDGKPINSGIVGRLADAGKSIEDIRDVLDRHRAAINANAAAINNNAHVLGNSYGATNHIRNRKPPVLNPLVLGGTLQNAPGVQENAPAPQSIFSTPAPVAPATPAPEAGSSERLGESFYKLNNGTYGSKQAWEKENGIIVGDASSTPAVGTYMVPADLSTNAFGLTPACSYADNRCALKKQAVPAGVSMDAYASVQSQPLNAWQRFYQKNFR